MKPFSESDRYDYPELTRDSWVIDAGAHRGQWSAEIFRRHRCHVVAYEPITCWFVEAQASLAAIGPRVTLIKSGVGAISESRVFRIKGDSTGAWADDGPPEKVRLTGIADVLAALPGGRADLLKLNIEGGEFDVLEAAIALRLTPRIRDIQVQWHPVAPNADVRFRALQSALAAHRHLTFDAGWTWQNWRRQ